MAGDREHPLHRQLVLLQHHGRQLGPVAQVQVALSDPAVGLGEAHLGVVEHHVEQRPFRVGVPELRQRRGSEPAADSVPAGQVEAHLRPREHPRDRPQVLEAPAARPALRPRCDPQLAQLFDRADLQEPPLEPWRLDEPAVRGAGWAVDRRGQFAKGVGGVATRAARRRRLQHRRRDLLDVAAGDGAVAIAREDDLSLLGDLEASRDRAWRLGPDCPVGRAAAPAESSAAAVEQGQSQTPLLRPRGQRGLRVMQGERR